MLSSLPYISSVPSPCYMIDLDLIEQNLRVLASVRERTGAKVLLALKGFAAFCTAPLINQYLDGTCASGAFEARLGAEEFGGAVHAYSPAFSDESLTDTARYATEISFNSPAQWQRFRPSVPSSIRCGLRINPEQSEAPRAIYDPCAPGSRLGTRASELQGADLDGISGCAFHTLCEADSHALERTLKAVEEKFPQLLEQCDWVNFGGGHHITRADYDVDHLCQLITTFRDRHGVEVILEPGEAIALDAGFLIATVLDIVHNDGDTAILDTSASAHMPDVLEMPYRPDISGAGDPGTRQFSYRLGGQTCLAGDIIGEYSFDTRLEIGQRLVFHDMAHYSMVKNNTFNGVPLPAIATHSASAGTTIVKEFTYRDYRDRLS